MIDILRDSIWQFVGAIISVLALIVAIIFFYLQRTRKAISYEIISDVAVLSIREELDGKIELLYERIPVQNVHLIIVKIYNSGNISIRPEDYDEKHPITILLNEESEILSEEIVKMYPNNLDVIIKSNKNQLILEPFLLNKKEWVTVKMLVSGFKDDIEIENRHKLHICKLLGLPLVKVESRVSIDTTGLTCYLAP